MGVERVVLEKFFVKVARVGCASEEEADAGKFMGVEGRCGEVAAKSFEDVFGVTVLRRIGEEAGFEEAEVAVACAMVELFSICVERGQGAVGGGYGGEVQADERDRAFGLACGYADAFHCRDCVGAPGKDHERADCMPDGGFRVFGVAHYACNGEAGLVSGLFDFRADFCAERGTGGGIGKDLHVCGNGLLLIAEVMERFCQGEACLRPLAVVFAEDALEKCGRFVGLAAREQGESACVEDWGFCGG